jgi:hypothetical protein
VGFAGGTAKRIKSDVGNRPFAMMVACRPPWNGFDESGPIPAAKRLRDHRESVRPNLFDGLPAQKASAGSWGGISNEGEE